MKRIESEGSLEDQNSCNEVDSDGLDNQFYSDNEQDNEVEMLSAAPMQNA